MLIVKKKRDPLFSLLVVHLIPCLLRFMTAHFIIFGLPLSVTNGTQLQAEDWDSPPNIGQCFPFYIPIMLTVRGRIGWLLDSEPDYMRIDLHFMRFYTKT
jgi:hypothetical protein